MVAWPLSCARRMVRRGTERKRGFRGGNVFCPTHSRVIAIYQNRGEKLGSEETAVGRRGEARQWLAARGDGGQGLSIFETQIARPQSAGSVFQKRERLVWEMEWIKV